MAEAAPSPGTALSLTFQVPVLAQEAGGCHGDSLWGSAKDAALASPPTSTLGSLHWRGLETQAALKRGSHPREHSGRAWHRISFQQKHRGLSPAFQGLSEVNAVTPTSQSKKQVQGARPGVPAACPRQGGAGTIPGASVCIVTHTDTR